MAVSKVLALALSDGVVTPGVIFGLTMSTAGASTTMTIAAGFAADSTFNRIMRLPSAIAKTTATWAVGTAAGGMDTGAVANSTWYHFFEIMRPDTGLVDVLFSLSATAPTLPANYTLFRRIGSAKTNGSGQWTLFTQNGDEFLWDVQLGDINTAVQSTTAILYTLTVPTGIRVNALFAAEISQASASTVVFLSSPDQSDQAASGSSFTLGVPSAAGFGSGQMNLRTNTSAQIRARSQGTSTTLVAATQGWIDTRGKNA
jgi:hypothetical protein